MCGGSSFPRYFSGTDTLQHEIEQPSLGIGNAHYQIHEFLCKKAFLCPGENPFKASLRVANPEGHWWRRRDSCSISFEMGWTMPSSCTRSLVMIRAQERSVLFGLQADRSFAESGKTSKYRILVSARPLPDQPIYESLQGRRSWPSSTPRRCHISRRRLTQGSPNEPRYHFALADKGDH